MNSTLGRLLKYIPPYRGKIAIVAVTGVLYAAAYSQLGFIIKGIIDGFEKGRPHDVTNTAALGLGLAFIIAVSRYLHIFNMNMTAERVVNDLRLQLQEKFMGLSIGFHTNYEAGSGGLMSRIINDIKVIQDGLRMVADFFREPLLAVLLLGNLFYLNWRLTLTILIVLPLILYFLRQISRSLRKYVLWGQEHQERMTSAIKESLDGVRTIQSFNLEPTMRGKLSRLSEEYLGIRAKVHRRIEIMGPVTEFIATFMIMAIFYYFSSEVARGRFTSGDVIAYIGMMMMINSPLKKLQESYVRIQETVVAAARVFSILDNPSVTRPSAHLRPFPKDWKKIVYRNVSFAYGSAVTLHGISFEVHRGERVAFVGPSGSGKSTLVNLLPRFYDQSSGEILIDNIPIQDFDLTALRENVSLVSQDVFLFSDTVENNILAGQASRGPETIAAAARAANAHDFITRLPQGYQTHIGERGGLLSGGEKQRLSIARALYKNAPILILDEATSALDSSSEKEVQKGLDVLMEGRTSLVIAHRLSTIQNADRIYVMKDGRIVASGKHTELLGNSPDYSHFWSLQSQATPVRA